MFHVPKMRKKRNCSPWECVSYEWLGEIPYPAILPFTTVFCDAGVSLDLIRWGGFGVGTGFNLGVTGILAFDEGLSCPEICPNNTTISELRLLLIFRNIVRARTSTWVGQRLRPNTYTVNVQCITDIYHEKTITFDSSAILQKLIWNGRAKRNAPQI